VRVVQVGEYSLELCGGCHVPNTSEIGLFKIVSESGIGAGTRRMEAVTGEGAYRLLNGQVQLLKEAATKLKTKPQEVGARIDVLLSDMKELQRENQSLASKLGNIEASNLSSKAKEVNGVTMLVSKVAGTDMNNLRTMVDDLKNKLGSGIIVLASVQDGKVNISAGVTKDLIEKGYHAGKVVKEVATRCGGGGGGRPDMAQAGGKNPEQVDSALQSVEDWIKSV
jgi:alanyl-tRNA synthetase